MARNTQSQVKSFPNPRKVKRDRFVRFLKFLNISAVVLLLTWVVVGNIIASELEKPFLQARAELIARFPKTETNASAKKVEELSAKLGISPPIKNTISVLSTDSTAFSGVKNNLFTYVNTVLYKKLDDNIEPPNKVIQSYLSTKSNQIADLRNHLLNNPLPEWRTISLDDDLRLNTTQIGFGYFSEIKSILFTKALDDIRLGKTQEALDNLEASQKLNQSFLTRPDLLSSLISMIGFKEQLKILREFDRLPIKWQRIKSPDFAQLVRTPYQTENIRSSMSIHDFALTKGGLYGNEKPLPLLNKILQLFQQPIWTFSAVYNWSTNTEILRNAELSNRDICQFKPQALPNKNDIIEGMDYSVFFKNFFRTVITWDLTQKIVNLREIAHQLGRFPESLPEKDFSPLCKDYSYSYQVSPKGDRMTIALNNVPTWLHEYNYEKNKRIELPFTYTANFKRTLIK